MNGPPLLRRVDPPQQNLGQAQKGLVRGTRRPFCLSKATMPWRSWSRECPLPIRFQIRTTSAGPYEAVFYYPGRWYVVDAEGNRVSGNMSRNRAQALADTYNRRSYGHKRPLGWVILAVVLLLLVLAAMIAG
jgi:hypothetical protein